MQNISIKETLSGKTIFVVGGTGFIGKVWLALVLHTLPDVKKVYVLCRKKGVKTAQEVFEHHYQTSPVFESFRQTQKTSVLPKNFEIVGGDVCQDSLGLKEELYKKLQQEVDLVVNFAADLHFDGPLDSMIETNVRGALRVGDFTLGSAQAKLVHVSTCYVAGEKTGLITESLEASLAPNGSLFHAQEEYQEAQKEIEFLHQQKVSSLVLKDAGKKRAQKWGWVNAYTYTKSLAERLLVEKMPQNQVTFFRPSIVENSLAFPFPGWNEDINGTAPLAYLLTHGQIFLIAKPHYCLDVIPVDFVAKSLMIASVAILRHEHVPVYQTSSSAVNPLSVGEACRLGKMYYNNKNKKITLQNWYKKFQTCIISDKKYIGFKTLEQVEGILNSLGFLAQSRFGRDFGLKNASKSIKNISSIMKTYKPFMHDFNYTFQSQNISEYAKNILEKDFWVGPENIFWEDYVTKTYFPGQERWCFPQLQALLQRKL